jgi:hypothetical protein
MQKLVGEVKRKPLLVRAKPIAQRCKALVLPSAESGFPVTQGLAKGLVDIALDNCRRRSGSHLGCCQDGES